MGKSRGKSARGKPESPNSTANKFDKAAFATEEDDGASSDASTDASVQYQAAPQPTLANILAAIAKMEGDMNTRFDTLDSKLHLVQASLAEHTTRITDLECCASDYETRITSLERRHEELMGMNKATKSKLIDLENRSRRSNIKITGLPEKVERGNPTQFVADLLPQILGPDSFPSVLKVDRAHRTGPTSLTRPRIMIAKIHHFPEKEKILKLARLQSPLFYNGARISIFPDFSPEISELRRAFDGAKKKLRDAGVKHGILFPARLILTFGAEQKIFLKPADAEAFIDRFITPALAPHQD